jgi:CYTH domain-containing protein
MEDEYEMGKDEFLMFRERCLQDTLNSKYITKDRYIYKDGDLKWEVDLFENDYKLIVAEIEIPKRTYKLIIPDFIKEVLLMEVTGLKQFSNRSLSLNINELNNSGEFRT